MPTNVVKTKEDERHWRRAKKAAAQQGRANDYAYIMAIFKTMTGLKKATAGASQPIHVTQVQPSWLRMPGAASMLRNKRSAEDRYLNDLYTPKGMPTVKILISEGGPFTRPSDVPAQLGFSPADEAIWATRIADWIARSPTELHLRTIMFASLRDYPEIDPTLRAELARRTLALFRERRRNAGDFMVKSNPPLLVKARDFQGRQSQMATQIRDRTPPGVGRHPGRTIAPDNAPGRGSPANMGPQRPPPPPTPTDPRDTGIKDDGKTGALDTDDLAGGPQDKDAIRKKLESLVNALHDLHAHMGDDDDHLVAMHNAIKDKMRDVYNDPTPDGLRTVQHLIHHFHEIVMGAPVDDEEGNPKQPLQPPMMRKSTGPIYFDFI